MMTCQTTVPLPDDERRKAADFRSHAHWRRVSIITHPILWSGLSAPGGSVVPCVVRGGGGGGGGSARWFVGGEWPLAPSIRRNISTIVKTAINMTKTIFRVFMLDRGRNTR